VTKIYSDGTQAVTDSDLLVPDGSLAILVGPSGCGKTTLLRMAAGLEDITEGQIAIGGEVVNDLSPKQRDIAMIFQNYALYPHMTVYDEWHSVCSCGARRRPRSTDGFGRPRARSGSRSTWERKPRFLSGGQR
jgi:multiple sugar transport system ATP-binding protein